MKVCVHLFMEAQELAVSYSTMQDAIHMDIVSLKKERTVRLFVYYKNKPFKKTILGFINNSTENL